MRVRHAAEYSILYCRCLHGPNTLVHHADNIYVPKDRVTNKHKGHAFVEFKGEEDADYVRIFQPWCSCRPLLLVISASLVAIGEHAIDCPRVQAIKVLNMIKVHGKPVRVNKASQEKKALDVGANLFIGNLDPDVDEKLLYDTFSAFGVIVATPKIMRDPDSGAPATFSNQLFSKTPFYASHFRAQLSLLTALK